jgi:hypothetical protein
VPKQQISRGSAHADLICVVTVTQGSRLLVLACVIAIAVAACAEAPEPRGPDGTQGSVVSPLDLRVRNSGIQGGYLWLGMVDQPSSGRWHRIGEAEFGCVTCPKPFVGFGSSYVVVVLDEACRVLAAFQPLGGQLQVEIDIGLPIKLIKAPPLGDWIPGDSPPADPATIPCAPPITSA